MNATPRTAQPVNAIATCYASAAALISAAEVLLRRLGYTEVGNDALSHVVVDLNRIGAVLTGRANGAQHAPPAPIVAPSAPITMPEFVPNNLPAADDDAPVDPVGDNDDDGPVDDVAIATAMADDDTPQPCPKCKGKGKLFGRPCRACQGTATANVEHVATVAANAPVAAARKAAPPAQPAAPVATSKGATRPNRQGNYTVMGHCVKCFRPGSMPNRMPFTVDQPTIDQSCFMCSTHADERDAKGTSQAAPVAAQPALKQGNSSAPLNAPAPKASAKAAPASAAPVTKATPVAPAPLPVAPPANDDNADRVAYATEALEKGSLKALALACARCELDVTASAGAKAMREALATWVMSHDATDDDATEAAPEPVAPPVAVPSKGAVKPTLVVAPVASKPAPKVKASKPATDTSETGGLPLNQWRMLLALDAADGAPLTYAEIRDAVIAEYQVNYYSGMTAALRESHPESLSDRGLTTECTIDVGGKSKFAFSITAAGRALVAQHS